MKNHKVSRAFCLLLIMFISAVPYFAATDEDDPYSVRAVKELLKQPVGFSSGFSEKQVQRLGDRLSIALLKIYSEEELTNPESIKRYLPLVQDAFRFPKLVPLSEDRQPRVTLVLLEFLLSRTRDENLKKQISTTERIIREGT
jgi:hypothetical protein